MSCSRQMLAKKLQAETKEETQNQLPSDAMIELYKKMSLEDLGNTKLVAGRCSGQTCKMVREEDPGYVAWLLQHQGKNPRFQALFLYVERLEQLLVKKSKGGQKEEKQEKPQPQVTRLENDNFPHMQTPDSSDEEEQMICSVRPSPRRLQDFRPAPETTP